MDYASAFQSVIADPRYQRNLDWGKARPGHPEGTVRAHIEEIELNLEVLKPKLSETDFWKLKLLIHTHDSFKAESKPGVPITDPASHASLAKLFLAEFCPDTDLLAMVQYHDELFALWRQVESKGAYNQQRMTELLSNIQDWNLFLAFNIIDGCTEGKSRECLRWLFKELEGKVLQPSRRWISLSSAGRPRLSWSFILPQLLRLAAREGDLASLPSGGS